MIKINQWIVAPRILEHGSDVSEESQSPPAQMHGLVTQTATVHNLWKAQNSHGCVLRLCFMFGRTRNTCTDIKLRRKLLYIFRGRLNVGPGCSGPPIALNGTCRHI
jgi:hypothetical protein